MANDKNSRVPTDRVNSPPIGREVPVSSLRSPASVKEPSAAVQRATGRAVGSASVSAVGSGIATAVGRAVGSASVSAVGSSIATATGRAASGRGNNVVSDAHPGGDGGEINSITGGQIDDVTLEATGAVHWPQGGLSAQSVISSSRWTGRRSQAEQIAIVEKFAPMAIVGVQELISAVEQKRFNDPETQEALFALKELHSALGDLIHGAERGDIANAIWHRVEENKEKLARAASNGARVMLVAPIVAIGTANVLSYLSGFPITSEMVTALCGSSLIANALIKK